MKLLPLILNLYLGCPMNYDCHRYIIALHMCMYITCIIAILHMCTNNSSPFGLLQAHAESGVSRVTQSLSSVCNLRILARNTHMSLASVTTFCSCFTSWALGSPRASNLHRHWRCHGDDRRAMVKTRLPQSAYYTHLEKTSWTYASNRNCHT
jgi:hypothetical protein